MLRTRPTLSALHEIPSAEAAVWPAMGPDFSLVGGAPSYAPAEDATRAAIRRAAARLGAEGLHRLAAPQAAAGLRPYQVVLATAGAHFKLGQTQSALQLLRGLCKEPSLTASLFAPALGNWAQLVHAHWLWLTAHVAIENGQGTDVLPVLWTLGLGRRAELEPRLATGLVVNAMQQGDEECLNVLGTLGVRLSHTRQQQLRAHTKAALEAYFGPDRKYVRRHPHKCATLAWLRRVHDVLELPTDIFAAYDAHVGKAAGASRAGWRRLVPCIGRATAGGAPAAQPPRRTTGVQLRANDARATAGRATQPVAWDGTEASDLRGC